MRVQMRESERQDIACGATYNYAANVNSGNQIDTKRIIKPLFSLIHFDHHQQDNYQNVSAIIHDDVFIKQTRKFKNY